MQDLQPAGLGLVEQLARLPVAMEEIDQRRAAEDPSSRRCLPPYAPDPLSVGVRTVLCSFQLRELVRAQQQRRRLAQGGGQALRRRQRLGSGLVRRHTPTLLPDATVTGPAERARIAAGVCIRSSVVLKSLRGEG
jgi:hypothetical protein